MITFPMLGSYGRTGNQLFQFAATYYAARKIQSFAAFPIFGNDLRWFNLDSEVKFLNTQDLKIENVYRQNESDYSFDEMLGRLPVNTALVGYFQNIKYINEFEKDIRKMLTFKDGIGENANFFLESKRKPGFKLVSLHVRRGDYLKIQDVLPVCNIQYYKNAIERIRDATKENLQFIVFSDDIEWCKNNLAIDDCIFFENLDIATNFRAMTLCDHHIIANSSFSWWGAWIANCGLVIKPKTWFGPAGPINYDQMFPEKWISIDEN